MVKLMNVKFFTELACTLGYISLACFAVARAIKYTLILKTTRLDRYNIYSIQSIKSRVAIQTVVMMMVE